MFYSLINVIIGKQLWLPMFMSDDATINLYICTLIIKNKDQ